MITHDNTLAQMPIFNQSLDALAIVPPPWFFDFTFGERSHLEHSTVVYRILKLYLVRKLWNCQFRTFELKNCLFHPLLLLSFFPTLQSGEVFTFTNHRRTYKFGINLLWKLLQGGFLYTSEFPNSLEMIAFWNLRNGCSPKFRRKIYNYFAIFASTPAVVNKSSQIRASIQTYDNIYRIYQ